MKTGDKGPFGELKDTLRTALQFEPVLPGSLELEYKFHLEEICRATFEREERIVVMDFLHYSFAPANANSEWRSIFNGLRILNALIDSGSSKVFSEVLEGKHFDVLQKTLFLTNYPNSDERIAKLIRTAAQEVRDKLLVKFNEVEVGETEESAGVVQSISSKDAPALPQVVPQRSLPLIASLRHTEDSSEEEEDPPRLGAQLLDLL